MLGKQLHCRSCPSSFGKSQVPKCPNLWPWPPLADAVSEGKLCPPGALLWCFPHEDKLFFRMNPDTDLGRSRGEGVSYCWSLQPRAGCERWRRRQKQMASAQEKV